MHPVSPSSLKFVWDLVYQPIRKWRDRRRAERVLWVTTIGKTSTLQEIAAAAKLTADQTLAVLRDLRDKDTMLSINVDELPPDALWRRI